MKLEELEKTLQNGLHDSRVSRIAIDYEQRKLALDIDVWMGDMGDGFARTGVKNTDLAKS